MTAHHKDLVFIVSGGRTGTQFLGDRLSLAIENSYSVHEPDILPISVKRVGGRLRTFGLWNMVFGKALGLSGIRVLGQRAITGTIDRETCRAAATALRMRRP